MSEPSAQGRAAEPEPGPAARRADAPAPAGDTPEGLPPVPQGAPGLDPLRVRVDLRRLTTEQAAHLRRLCYHHKLLVLEAGDLSEPEYIAFARTVGTPEPYFQDHYHHPDHPEIFVSSNIKVDGQKVGVAGTGRMWHTDYSFFDRPLAFTCVYPRILPSVKRETYYIDMARVYADLPRELKDELAGLTFFHDAWDYYKVQPWDIDRAVAELIEDWHAEAPGASHPAVVVHPSTGERILFFSKGFTKRVEGVTHERGTALIQQLADLVDQPAYRHRQVWQEGDLFMWDNRTLIHHASTVPQGEPSCSYRISLYDELPFRV